MDGGKAAEAFEGGSRCRGTDVIAMLRGQGIAVAVWSDYPVEAKLKALDVAADHMLSASDDDIKALKPNPTGLRLAMERAGVKRGKTLMVGDRLSRDGAAAAAVSVDFLLRSDKMPGPLSERQFYVRDYRAFLSGDPQIQTMPLQPRILKYAGTAGVAAVVDIDFSGRSANSRSP